MGVLPAIAVEAVVPITRLLVPLPVPAPIKVLTSAPVIPLFKVGIDPSLKIAGVPVSVTLAVLFVIAVACVVVIPTLAVLFVIAVA